MKWKMALLSLILCGLLAVQASAADCLWVDGVDLWDDVMAQTVHDTTYVSLRYTAQLLLPEAKVAWSNGQATVTAEGVTLTAVPGEDHLVVNGRSLYARNGILLIQDRVMVPIRVLADALGGQVDWSPAQGVVLITGAGQTVSPSPVPPAASYSQEDLYWLSRIISAESRGEPLQGKIAVGTVVLNRVASSEFPDTIYGVIFDREWGVQFTPVANGTVYDDPTEESVLAAKMVLEGAREAGDSLYFLAPDLTDNHWTMENREYVTTIGCHWFYR